jgi:hypothetical protein
VTTYATAALHLAQRRACMPPLLRGGQRQVPVLAGCRASGASGDPTRPQTIYGGSPAQFGGILLKAYFAARVQVQAGLLGCMQMHMLEVQVYCRRICRCPRHVPRDQRGAAHICSPPPAAEAVVKVKGLPSECRVGRAERAEGGEEHNKRFSQGTCTKRVTELHSCRAFPEVSKKALLTAHPNSPVSGRHTVCRTSRPACRKFHHAIQHASRS